MIRWIAGALLAAAVSGASAQDPARTLMFTLDRPGPPVTQYSILLKENGEGTYAPKLASDPAALSGSPEDKALHVAPALVKKLFAAVPTVEGGRCETHNKGIAKTGIKTMQYVGAGRTGQCTFNYSDDDRVNDATMTFEALAETMRFGDRLASKLRFDRLGLDTEVDELQGAVNDGRALELGNIAPVLKAISDDDRVMDRVRRKTVHMLEAAGVSAAGTDANSR